MTRSARRGCGALQPDRDRRTCLCRLFWNSRSVKGRPLACELPTWRESCLYWWSGTLEGPTPSSTCRRGQNSCSTERRTRSKRAFCTSTIAWAGAIAEPKLVYPRKQCTQGDATFTEQNTGAPVLLSQARFDRASENSVADAHAGSVGRESRIAPLRPVLVLRVQRTDAEPPGQLHVHAATKGDIGKAAMVAVAVEGHL